MHGLYKNKPVTYTIYNWPVVVSGKETPHWWLTVLADSNSSTSGLNNDGEDADFYCAQPPSEETLLIPMDHLKWSTEKDAGFGIDPPPTVSVNLIDSTGFDSPVRGVHGVSTPGSIGTPTTPGGTHLGDTYNPNYAYRRDYYPETEGLNSPGTHTLSSGDNTRQETARSLDGAAGDDDSIDYSDYEIATPLTRTPPPEAEAENDDAPEGLGG